VRSDFRVTALDDVLRHVEMAGIFYCSSELSEPWGLEIPPMDSLWFHVITSGHCNLAVPGLDTVRVGPGDLVLVPHGQGHAAWGEQPSRLEPVLELPHDYETDTYAVLRHGGGGDVTSIVCGSVRFDHPAARHLVSSLPVLIHIEAARIGRTDWLRATLDLLAEETRTIRPGSDAVVSRLCDVLVLQAIRAWIDSDPAARSGWLGAVRDDGVGAAIAAVHGDPGGAWSVGTLADVANMSRSAFAARFSELVGMPPMQYVTRWRMYTADGLLRRGATVAAAGRAVGYESEAAFSRAYARVMGAPAGAARRAAA
jgi:AraC-like DNA-binding protein